MPEDSSSIYTIMAERVANAILGKINALIGSHNTNEQTHQDIRKKIINESIYSVKTLYSLSGTSSSFDFSSVTDAHFQSFQTPIFVLARNTIGDNTANATMKVTNSGNTYPILDNTGGTISGYIGNGVWKKDSWGLFLIVPPPAPSQLYNVFADIDEVYNSLYSYLGIKGVYTVNSINQNNSSKTVYTTDPLLNGNLIGNDEFIIIVNSYETNTDKNVYINHLQGSVPLRQSKNYLKESDVNGCLLRCAYNGGAIQVSNISTNKLIPLLSDLSIVAQTGNYDHLVNKPNIPSKTSDLTNDSGYLTAHQNISGKEDKSNKVTSISSSSTDTEYPSAKAVFDSLSSVPSASSVTPSADTTNGSVGDGTTWARSNHTHPKSSLYAEASHTHSQYLTSHQDITGKEDKSNKITSLNEMLTESDTDYPSSLLVLNHLDTKEDISNKVTSMTAISTDDEYPSAKCVYDGIWNDFYGTIQGEYVQSNDLGTVALSNDYDDLDNKPTIPIATSDLTNDGDGTNPFLTEHQSLSNYVQKSQTSGLLKNDGTVDTTSYSTFDGNYNNLTNKPSIPSNTSDLTNDSQFITIDESDKEYIPSFNENETVINKYFNSNKEVKFHYSRTTTTDCDGYIQIGDNEGIIIGVVETESTNHITIQDNLSEDTWVYDLSNLDNSNSFDISIRIEPNTQNIESLQLNDTFDYYIILTVDETIEQEYSPHVIITKDDDNNIFLNRNYISKVVQDTNSRITDLTFSTSGVYVEKLDLNNNSTSLDPLLADMINYGMDNDSEW